VAMENFILWTMHDFIYQKMQIFIKIRYAELANFETTNNN
jgi:hypothetical protein